MRYTVGISITSLYACLQYSKKQAPQNVQHMCLQCLDVDVLKGLLDACANTK